MDDSHRDDSAATLVGRLIRSYRDDVISNGKRLTQEGLLYLMVERGEEYATDLDRSNVSRWESGARLAPTFPISTLQGLPQSATELPDVAE